jgi:hypothetical protein
MMAAFFFVSDVSLDAGLLFQLGSLVRLFPRKLGFVAAEMAVTGRLPINGPAQVQ